MHAADRPTGMNHAHEQDEASRTHAMEKTQNRDICVSFLVYHFFFLWGWYHTRQLQRTTVGYQ